jgi:hypothetical protein
MKYSHRTFSSKQTRISDRAGRVGKPFDRELELPKLIGIWPSELRDDSAEQAARIIALLRKALRAQRRLGRAAHWTYDLNRHLALVEALRSETARLIRRNALRGNRCRRTTGNVDRSQRFELRGC